MNSVDPELSNERFGFTVFLSACAHAILILGVGFTYFSEQHSEAALEVTMAQYRSELAPENPDFLAQENQTGSGSLEETAAPSTPFVSEFHDNVIQEVQPVPQTPEVFNEIEVQDIPVIASVNNQREVSQQLELLEPDPELPLNEQSNPEDIRLAIASLQAQLDLQRQEYARRPRKYTISSASTLQSHDAQYLDSWRRRIEAVGNLNYPTEARRQQLYGSLQVMVAILPSGEVHTIEILRSSGHSILDQAVRDIVALAAPFQPFPEVLREEADILEIVRTWRFHEGNALTSY